MKTVFSPAFRRIAALLLLIILLVPLVSPFTAPAAETEEREIPALASSSPDDGLITESEVYQYLLSEVLKCKTDIDIADYELDEKEVGELFSTLFYSEAELFFITGGYSFTRYQGSSVVRKISPEYPENVEDVPTLLAEFHELTDAILSQVDPALSDWEKVAFIHDYIALHFDYDHRVESRDEEERANVIYDAYGMLKEGIGVCQAYSLLVRYLLRRLGIECECVSCKELNHEWNVVKLDGSWYHMDVTWDDKDDKGFYGQVSHEFFLASDSFFDAGVGPDRNHHSETGWVSPVRATSGRFDELYVGVTSPFVFTPGAIYALNDGTLSTYDPENDRFDTVLDLNLEWHTFGDPFRVWSGTYAGLWYLNGNLYWNGESEVWSYNPETGTKARVERYHSLSGTIFGMRAETEGCTTRFILALMRDPNSGTVTEAVRTIDGYLITWNVGGETTETVCMPGDVPRYDGSLELASNVFDYTFLQWNTTPRAASKPATYVAMFRMDRNDVTLDGKTLREQYRYLYAAELYLPYSSSGYSDADETVGELNDMVSAYTEKTDAVNTAFYRVLFGEE